MKNLTSFLRATATRRLLATFLAGQILIVSANAFAIKRDKNGNPIRLLPMRVTSVGATEAAAGSAATFTYSVKQLPADALLEISGDMPEQMAAAFDGNRKLLISGTTPSPQTCELRFSASQKGVFSKNIRSEFTITAPEQGVYSATAAIVDQTSTHYKFQITALNVSGLPIERAEVVTFLSGGAGGIYGVDKYALPLLKAGEQASVSIWVSKSAGLFPPSVRLIGRGQSSEIREERIRRAKSHLLLNCEYSEEVINTLF